MSLNSSGIFTSMKVEDSIHNQQMNKIKFTSFLSSFLFFFYPILAGFYGLMGMIITIIGIIM